MRKLLMLLATGIVLSAGSSTAIADEIPHDDDASKWVKVIAPYGDSMDGYSTDYRHTIHHAGSPIPLAGCEELSVAFETVGAGFDVVVDDYVGVDDGSSYYGCIFGETPRPLLMCAYNDSGWDEIGLPLDPEVETEFWVRDAYDLEIDVHVIPGSVFGEVLGDSNGVNEIYPETLIFDDAQFITYPDASYIAVDGTLSLDYATRTFLAAPDECEFPELDV